MYLQCFVSKTAQFSRTVADAAVSEMRQLREAILTFSTAMESTAELTNTTWPFYHYPNLITFAKEQVESKNLEALLFWTRVKHEDRKDFVDFQNQTHPSVIVKTHEMYFGNTSFLDQSGFLGDIVEFGPQGLAPSPVREEYYCVGYRYPPLYSFGSIGFDIRPVGDYPEMFESLVRLKNQTLISNIQPYIESSEAESRLHADFHSNLPDSSNSHPHRYVRIEHQRMNYIVAQISVQFHVSPSSR